MSSDTHIGNHRLAPETQMMRYGYDPALSEGSVKCPQFQTSTFVFKSAQEGKDFFNRQSGREPLPEGENSAGLIYSRFNNPVLEILEGRIALWDEAEECLVMGSGMAAISTTLLTLSKPGDVIVYTEPVYGGTDTLINSLLAQFQIRGVGFSSGEGVEGLGNALVTARKLGHVPIVHIETPDNPCNTLFDIEAAAGLLKEITAQRERRPILMVDNTMFGPLFQQPLKHGADLCLYSLTKYMGGHSDVLGGSCSGNHELISRIRSFRNTLGTTMDPNTAWMIMRSLETLKIRMQASAASAARIARYLLEHPMVESVNYTGFIEPGNPLHDVYARQCSGSGSTFSFNVKGDEAAAFRVLDAMKVAMLAVSLGGNETLVQHPASMTHSGVSMERRQQIGLYDSLIRISVGLENPDDIIADLAQALEAI